MRGFRLHNEYMAGPLSHEGRRLGAKVSPEHPVSPGQRPRSVDLFLTWENHRIVIEVGCSVARVHREVRKARDLHADLLLLVFPTPRLVAAARRKLRRLAARHAAPRSMAVRSLTLGMALDALRRPDLLRQWLSHQKHSPNTLPGDLPPRDLAQEPNPQKGTHR